MTEPHPDHVRDDGWLLGGEAAAILHVTSKTISRWAKEGKIPCQRTLGGHRRFNEAVVRALAATLAVPATNPSPPSRPGQAVTGRPRR